MIDLQLFHKSRACAEPYYRWCPGCWGRHPLPTSNGSSPLDRDMLQMKVDIRPNTRTCDLENRLFNGIINAIRRVIVDATTH